MTVLQATLFFWTKNTAFEKDTGDFSASTQKMFKHNHDFYFIAFRRK